MTLRKVRANSVYVYSPVGLDSYDPPYGVKEGELSPGDKVRVVKLPGCPPPNTMGHAHIEHPVTKQFLGLVCTNSLAPCGATAKGASSSKAN